jgi:hypothetical protein
VTYFNCPRCRLSIRLPRAASIAPRHCPRCIARHGVATPLFPSPLSLRELEGEEKAEPDDDQSSVARLDYSTNFGGGEWMRSR